MKNADIKYKVETLITLLDVWLESIDNETPPVCALEVSSLSADDIKYACESGAYKARAEMNADKLRRVRELLLNEFENVGVQSRKNNV